MTHNGSAAEQVQRTADFHTTVNASSITPPAHRPSSHRQPQDLYRPPKWRTRRERSSICTYARNPAVLIRGGEDSRGPYTAIRTSKLLANPARKLGGLVIRRYLLWLKCDDGDSTSPASAAPPTASSRPTTTPPSRSPSARLTRTAVSPMSASVTVSSRTSGPPSDKRKSFFVRGVDGYGVYDTVT
ncbi:hypothetical protein DTO271G3_777 [Paecilomyces variotii]|nr:hypothetical protein DTO271G3_777 [Paecilomyces variotii]